MESLTTQRPASIAAMVAKAVETGIPFPQPPQRRRSVAETYECLKKLSERLYSNDDSDFDDSFISDSLWNKMYKHEDKEFDQHIFNVFRQDKIETQERKVNITTAISVRDCPGKAEEIAMWTKLVKPVLSKAPKRKQVKKRLKTTKH